MRLNRTQLFGASILSLFTLLSFTKTAPPRAGYSLVADSLKLDSVKVKSGKKPINVNKSRPSIGLLNPKVNSPLIYNPKKQIKTAFRLDSSTNINVTEQIKLPADSLSSVKILNRPPSIIPLQDFKNIERKSIGLDLWRQNAKKYDGQSEIEGRKLNPKLLLGDGLDKIFGNNGPVEFKANGNVLLDFGVSELAIGFVLVGIKLLASVSEPATMPVVSSLPFVPP